MLDQKGLIAYCTKEACVTAIEEAKATAIEVGRPVGHTDFATYGTKSGKLQGYEGDEAIVKNEAGDEWKWKTEGMVDIERVYELTEQYIMRMDSLLSIMELGEALGVPAQETLNKLLGPPNEDCNCEYCTKRKAELAEGTGGGGGITPENETPVEEVAAAATTPTSANGTRFPFDQFLNTVKAD